MSKLFCIEFIHFSHKFFLIFLNLTKSTPHYEFFTEYLVLTSSRPFFAASLVPGPMFSLSYAFDSRTGHYVIFLYNWEIYQKKSCARNTFINRKIVFNITLFSSVVYGKELSFCYVSGSRKLILSELFSS